MRYINSIAVPLVCLTLMMSGCASLELMSEAPVETKPTSQDVPQTQLTSFELLALELQRQPNLYHQNTKSVGNQTRSQFQSAIKYKEQGELANAEEILLRLSNEQPFLSGPFLQLGDIYLLGDDENKLARAEAQYRQALAINQHNYHAHNRLAQVLRQQGKFADAESHYRKAIASWPAFKPAYLNLGILYDLYLGDKTKALEHYQTYQALNDTPERRVKGWIADLSRQVANQKTSQLAEVN